MLISRPHSRLETPESLPTSTAEIRNAFQQSRPRKRNKRSANVFEIAEDQENVTTPESPESILPFASATTVLYQSDMALWKSGAVPGYAPSSCILKAGGEQYPAKVSSAISAISCGSKIGTRITPESTDSRSMSIERNARRNAPARASQRAPKRAPLGGLYGDLNAPALVIDHPGANCMKENIPPGWQQPQSGRRKNVKASMAPSQRAVRCGPIYESASVFEGLSKSDESPADIASGANSTKKTKSTHVWRYGNSLQAMAHKPTSSLNSLETLIPPSISSIKALQPLTASFISFLSFNLAVAISIISSVKTNTKRKAVTMEDLVRSTHAKMQLRAAREAETARVPALILLKTILYSGKGRVEDFPLTWELERRFQYHKLVDKWLRILRREYGVHAGSLRKRFLTRPLPAANLIKDYLLCITSNNYHAVWEPQSLEELLLHLGCSASSAALLNKIKKLDVDLLMGIVAVLALKAQAVEQ